MDADEPVTPVDAGGIRRMVARSSLQVRLAALSALLAAMVMIVTFSVLSVQVRQNTQQLFARELIHNGRTLVALQHESRRQLVLTASLIAESPTLHSAISTYRSEQLSGSATGDILTNTVQNEVRRLGANLRLSTTMRGTELASLPAVRNALDASLVTNADEPYLDGLEVDGHYFGVGVAPLIVDGFTIGTIVVGEPVDSSLVTTLKRDFDGEIVVSAGERIISATLPDSIASIAAREPGNAERALALGPEEYLAAIVPIGKTQRGTPLRITLLQPLTPTVKLLRDALLRDFLIYGLAAVILAGLGAAALTRSVLRPLRAFIQFMGRGAERERLDESFDATGAAREIRALNESFNQLMAALSGKRVELERRGSELAAATEVLTDEVRERERVERALRDSEAQLRQSQKLEAIGTLAGGIAHDFNNMLTVISGFTQLAMSSLGQEHPVTADLKQVSDAARSAATLTHQLLAFSRKQVMQPRVLDLEMIVSNMEGMLRRLIGSRITLEVSHDGAPARVKADPGQLEQVLLNLTVNARDAMPDGGELHIVTGHRSAASGANQVMLQVRDTGIGMSEEVRDRIFEPFFTTKEVGKGTGLGLATVYGIVAQSGGSIEVDSAPGRGTTFTVALPPIAESVTHTPVDSMAAVLPRGAESILIVDDEEAVLDLARRTLESCGYSVRVARNGVEALTMARGPERIDAIVTDVIMPNLSGPQIVERCLVRHPEARVVYITGYFDDEIVRLEVDEEVRLVRKPFTPAELARTVRSALDSPRTSATFHGS